MKRRWIVPLVLVMAGILVFFVYSTYHAAPKINFNDLHLIGLNGQPASISDFSGKKLVITFGASWCGNCHDELRDILKVKQTGYPDVEFVVISDEPLEKVIAFKNRYDFPCTFLKMEGSFNSVGVQSIPTTYIMNRRQEVMKDAVGYIDWKDASTTQHLNKVME
jgi:thiol-disulfide isomerase/thioredoxin